jgi:hypothetical protein
MALHELSLDCSIKGVVFRETFGDQWLCKMRTVGLVRNNVRVVQSQSMVIDRELNLFHGRGIVGGTNAGGAGARSCRPSNITHSNDDVEVLEFVGKF